jgi:leader peptidase (prepilin peptidase) / N-methyltransferase
MLWLIPAFLVAALPVLYSLPQDMAITAMNRLFAGLFILMAIYDIATLRVPNILVYSCILFAISAVTLIDSSHSLDSLIGAVSLLVALYTIAMIGGGAMGMADVKVGIFTGAVLGLRLGVFAVLLGFAVAGVVAAFVLLTHLRKRKDVAPLTPFLAGGALAILVWFGSVVEV